MSFKSSGAVAMAIMVSVSAASAFAAESARDRRIEAQRARLSYSAAVLAKAPPQRSMSPLASLGAVLYSDNTLSLNKNQSCASCHALAPAIDPASGKKFPAPGFVDNANVENGSAVSDGSNVKLFGTLNAPSAGYAAFSPAFHWDAAEGLYVGGQFWNGRANDLAEQAAQPFLNPVEMAMPSRWAVMSRVKDNPAYVAAFRRQFGIDLNEIPKYELAPASAKPPGAVLAAYDAMTDAIAEFEKQRFFNRFTSKFDFVLAGATNFTPTEALGEQLFNGKALCNACHISNAGIAPDGTASPPLFTDFTYDNIGVPRNVLIPGNPKPNPGLGGRPDVAERDPSGSELGKHKVMSLRNVAMTAPYAHNGVFKSLAEIVHFYNTRDTLGRIRDNRSPGFGVSGWPAPEIEQNVNVDELGDLGLTAEEERAIVAFLLTLTDGYPVSGGDPRVPPGTKSPFAETPLPPFAR